MLTVASTLAAHPYANGGGPGWWIIFPIAWFLLIATAIFLFALRGGRRHYWHYGQFSGEQKLAERFAAGEIDEKEYQSRLAVLRQFSERR